MTPINLRQLFRLKEQGYPFYILWGMINSAILKKPWERSLSYKLLFFFLIGVETTTKNVYLQLPGYATRADFSLHLWRGTIYAFYGTFRSFLKVVFVLLKTFYDCTFKMDILQVSVRFGGSLRTSQNYAPSARIRFHRGGGRKCWICGGQ